MDAPTKRESLAMAIGFVAGLLVSVLTVWVFGPWFGFDEIFSQRLSVVITIAVLCPIALNASLISMPIIRRLSTGLNNVGILPAAFGSATLALVITFACMCLYYLFLVSYVRSLGLGL